MITAPPPVAGRVDAGSATFLPYVHSFRAVAMVTIVATHCMRIFFWETGDLHYQLMQSLLPNGTAFFVFIAGFLFQYLSVGFSYGAYLRKKWWNVMMPYLVTSAPIFLNAAWISGRWGQEAASAVWALLDGRHMMQLWFIPMIAVFYVLAPWFVWIDRRGALGWVAPLLLTLTVFVHRPLVLYETVHQFLYFLGFYVYGMWFSRHREQAMAWHRRWWPGLLAAAAGLVWLEIELGRPGYVASQTLFSTENGMVGLNAIQKVLLCGTLLVLLEKAERLFATLRPIGDKSFGIFFLHVYVLYGILNYTGGEMVGDFWQFLVSVPVVLAVSMTGAWVIQQAAGKYSRRLIGC